jgi:molybdenum cofactor cytidylyltransferase
MIATIILAAGASRRMGRPKQLLDWQGNPLIRHTALTALESGLGSVKVVVGAVDQPCRAALKHLPVGIIGNPNWQAGMGGSIAAGLSCLDLETLAGVIIMVCDQPLVTSNLLMRLESESKNANGAIVALKHQDGAGPPAYFPKNQIAMLQSLRDHEGARTILRRHQNLVLLDAPHAMTDLDTPSDWQRLIKLAAGTNSEIHHSSLKNEWSRSA